MASNYYIKLYHEILDDPKMGKLPDWLFRRAIELFLLAGENDKDGLLQPVADMAWRLRADERRFAESLQALSKVGVVHETPEGWMVTNFAKRQARVPDDERQRRKRERDKKQDYYRHEPVTERDIDIDTDKDKETDKDGEVEVEAEPRKPAAAAAINIKDPVMVSYSENMGALTPMIAEELIDLEKEYSAEWIVAAISEAVMKNVHNLKYVLAILKRWKLQGFKKQKSGGQPAAFGKKQTPAEALAEYAKEIGAVA